MEEKDSVPPETYKAYQKQAQSLSLNTAGISEKDDSFVKKAIVVTPNNAVLETAGGGHLPTVPVEEGRKLNELEAKVHMTEKGQQSLDDKNVSGENVNKERKKNPTAQNVSASEAPSETGAAGEPLDTLEPPWTTHPLFPPLPVYGPSSLTRNVQCYIFRMTSFFMTLIFLSVIFGCGIATALFAQIVSPERVEDRPFYQEEINRKHIREAEEETWYKRQRRRASATSRDEEEGEEEAMYDSFVPTEGGKDPIICDVAYYARRVGLDMEEYKVQTEDGFVIDLWHIYDPKEYSPKPAQDRSAKSLDALKYTQTSSFSSSTLGGSSTEVSPKRRYPVLMIHGLLQSSGAYCVNDDHSLAFYLAKSGYDVWLGNNRCGFNPKHTLLSYDDPIMWNWNIRQMGVFDLSALVARVLHETGFQKLGFVGHSQGTAQALIALAKSQQPSLGDKLSVFCALAPAAYAGPLLNRWYLKFFRLLSPAMYKIVFGIHAFIPIMMLMHGILPSKLFGTTGYMVFSYMFNWSDRNWDRGVRDRFFQFAPVYISSEAMRWWLGRDCFAKQKCILATQSEWEMDDVDDEKYDAWALNTSSFSCSSNSLNHDNSSSSSSTLAALTLVARKEKAWYDEHSPPMAFWVAGSDDLVDGRRLLKRLSRERGREPCVRIVKQKVIENYEHLDVIWAVDSIQQVGREVKECIWQTCPVRDEVVVPRRCEAVEAWVDPGPIVVGKEVGGEV